MDFKKIYLDMDGVLADFDRGVIELCGLIPQTQGKASREFDASLYDRMRDVGHFYAKIEPMEGAVEFFHQLYDKYTDKVEILSGRPKPEKRIDDAHDDKIDWIHRIMSEDVVCNIVLRKEKIDYCTGPDCILIDDFYKNIDEWEAAGGTGILHTSPADTIEKLKSMGIL